MFKETMEWLDLRDLVVEKDSEKKKYKSEPTHYSGLDIPWRIERYFFWSCLLNLDALIYNAAVAPLRAALSLVICVISRCRLAMSVRC